MNHSNRPRRPFWVRVRGKAREQSLHLPATVIGADFISVWNSGASADTSHWNNPDNGRPTDSSVTFLAFETDTCEQHRAKRRMSPGMRRRHKWNFDWMHRSHQVLVNGKRFLLFFDWMDDIVQSNGFREKKKWSKNLQQFISNYNFAEANISILIICLLRLVGVNFFYIIPLGLVRWQLQ